MYRSRKLCNFYHPLNDTISDEKRVRYHKAYNDRQLELQSQCTEGIVKELIARRIEDRYICETCGVMLANTELILKHNNHKIKQGLTNDDLNSPTILLRPQDDNTGQAVCYIQWNLCIMVTLVTYKSGCYTEVTLLYSQVYMYN